MLGAESGSDRIFETPNQGVGEFTAGMHDDKEEDGFIRVQILTPSANTQSC